jgi:hypothetical protein
MAKAMPIRPSVAHSSGHHLIFEYISLRIAHSDMFTCTSAAIMWTMLEFALYKLL